VTIEVDESSSSQLVVAYDAPIYDGGAEVLGYKIEYAETMDFGAAGSVVQRTERCSIDAAHEVVTVKTSSSAQVANGTFRLRIFSAGNGTEAETLDIRFDAAAMASEESATDTPGSGSGIFCQRADPNFPNDPLHACARDYVSNGGSMQSHVEFLSDIAGMGGVNVERTDLGMGQNEWAVTFLDNTGNVQVAISDNSLESSDGSPVVIAAVVRTNGEKESEFRCLNEKTLTNLIQGRPYYARVTAYNKEGYGGAAMAVSATDPSRSFVTPVRVPGRVRGASLTVVSGTQLRVTWSPPADDGGSIITEYKIRYATNSALTGFKETSLLYIPDGGPYSKTLSGLTPGQDYWALVYASNAQGVGQGQGTTPLFEAPRTLPKGPINVKAAATSSSSISVGFELPLDNGGDAVSGFVIEWDVDSEFESLALAPHRGRAEVSAATGRAYTITDLQAG